MYVFTACGVNMNLVPVLINVRMVWDIPNDVGADDDGVGADDVAANAIGAEGIASCVDADGFGAGDNYVGVGDVHTHDVC